MRILLFFLFFHGGLGNQQIKLSGYITDNLGHPIEYVNIVSLSKPFGTVTDKAGFFTIYIEKNDSIKISHIAYLSRIVAVNEILSDTIKLNENLNNIGEVIIKSSDAFHDKCKIGFYNKDNNGEFLLKPGNQIAVYIENPREKTALIKSVTFEVKKRGQCNSTLRLRILENLDDKMAPGQDLLKDNIVINSAQLLKSNSIDISRFKVYLPANGIFIVIEWIGNDSNCDLISFPSLSGNISTKQNLVWYNFRDKKWSKPERSQLRNGNFITPNIYLNVLF